MLSPCDASPLPGSVIMESLPGHFFSLFFIWSNYRWRGKRCFFTLLLFSPSYFSSSPLLAFRGALTAAFLLGTCLKGSRSMWCPLTVRNGCFLLALTSQASKDSFSTGTNFSLWIINCIQTLRAVWATCARGPREDHAVEKRTVEEKKKRRGARWRKKLDWKTRCSLWCCSVLVHPAANSYSNGPVFISALPAVCFLVLKAFHLDGPRNGLEVPSLWAGRRFAALMNGRNTRRAECAGGVLVCLTHKSPGMPPEEGLLHPLPSRLLLKGA